MSANLEVDLLRVRIMHMPDHADPVLVKHIADAEGEVVGIHLLRLFARFEGEGRLTFALGDELECGVAGETMTWQVIRLAIHTIGLVVHAAHDGEEDR